MGTMANICEDFKLQISIGMIQF